MFLFRAMQVFPGRGEKGPKQGVHKEALPQGQYTFHFA